MTDTDIQATPPAANGEGEGAAPGMRVLAQFIRDLSFENPRAPDSLRTTPTQPQIELNVEMNARARPDGFYEVDLKLTAKAQKDGQAQFQVELLYGGLFQITGLPEADLEPVLLIECPRYLFPFARRVIADLTIDGGFPPFMLDPIDFAAVYMARQAQFEAQTPGQA